jgi:hypothetical protein
VSTLGLRAAVVVVVVLGSPAAADPTSGIDGALFRSSYDANGVFAVEGARLMPTHDLSLKVLLGYAKSPLDVAVPGIGAAGDTTRDRILDDVMTLDLAFGMTLTDHVALGLDVAAYRTRTGEGYGVRGRYASGGTVAQSTGLVALRPVSNIDPSANPSDGSAYLGDGLAGPLDARLGLKLALISRPRLAITAIGSVFLPFGEDEMLLGDKNLVFEPALALEWRPDRVRATRLVANAALRLRQRTVLEGYDTQDPAATDADAKVFLDVGSEAVAGVGAIVELAPRALLAAEAQVFVPVPDALSWGDCRRYNGGRCSAIQPADYFGGAKHGDLTVLATVGAMLRVSADVTATVMVGTGQLGARGDDVRVTTGITWAPQPVGAVAPGRHDKDGDGVPDSLDACPNEPEDKDGFQDEDGCPDLDTTATASPTPTTAARTSPRTRTASRTATAAPSSTTIRTGSPTPPIAAPVSPRTGMASRTRTVAPTRTTTATGSPTPATSARTIPRRSTGSTTTMAVRTSAARRVRRSGPIGSISRARRSRSRAAPRR